jgi:hypothetical protein
LIRNSEYILDIQNGLKYYFDENNYVKRYKSEFKTSNSMMINQIDDEISELKSLRQKENINMNMSSFRVLSRAEDNEIQNQIIDLANLKNLINTQNLISSLDYVKDFTKTDVAERKVVVWGSAIGFIAFIISILIAIIIEVKQKAKRTKI